MQRYNLLLQNGGFPRLATIEPAFTWYWHIHSNFEPYEFCFNQLQWRVFKVFWLIELADNGRGAYTTLNSQAGKMVF